MSVVLQVFGHKLKYWTHFDLVMVLDRNSRDSYNSY